jgi:hypothetical protein
MPLEPLDGAHLKLPVNVHLTVSPLPEFHVRPGARIRSAKKIGGPPAHRSTGYKTAKSGGQLLLDFYFFLNDRRAAILVAQENLINILLPMLAFHLNG